MNVKKTIDKINDMPQISQNIKGIATTLLFSLVNLDNLIVYQTKNNSIKFEADDINEYISYGEIEIFETAIDALCQVCEEYYYKENLSIEDITNMFSGEVAYIKEYFLSV